MKLINDRIQNPTLILSLLLLVLLVLSLIADTGTAQANPGFENNDSLFAPLRQRLVADGVSEFVIDKYFDDPRFHLLPGLLRVNVRQPDASESYKGFVSPGSVKLTSDFLTNHRPVFEQVLDGSRVDPETVVSILRVESSLGNYNGKYLLLNVFASLTLLTSDHLAHIAPKFWEHVLKDIDPSDREAIRLKAKKRARSKAGWAYRELKILLELGEQGLIDPLEAKGSWAGAFGLPQFLPSSMQAYARDGNGDGRIELGLLDDAIASIANYLSVHGYRSDDPVRRKKAVWHYNHSDEYVTCILTLAENVQATNTSDSQ